MLLRPFQFAELKQPLQKLTILYAYAERPIITKTLTDKGRDLYEIALDNMNKEYSHLVNKESNVWRKFPNEKSNEYEERLDKLLDAFFAKYSTQEVYKGEIVQCTVNKQLCRFFPEEYTIIDRGTFDHVLTDELYDMEIENPTGLLIPDIQDKIFYCQSRGIDKTLAERMSAKNLNDNVLFRPKRELLECFCRENEIY